MSASLADLTEAQRSVLAALVRGDDVDDVAAETGRPPERVLRLARDGMEALAGAPEGVDARTRLAVGDYLLGRQSPGQAAGTWRLLDGSEAARAWADELRTRLAEAGLETPPPLPSDPGAEDPVRRSHRRRPGPVRDGDDPSLRERRNQRTQQRTAIAGQQAAAEMASPFRSEAMEAHRVQDDRIDLPRWAPRPVQLSVYAALVALVIGLGFAIFVRIPVTTNGLALVLDVPPGAPGADGKGGIQVLGVFTEGKGDKQGSGQDVRDTQSLRVQLPGRKQRTPMDITWVSPEPISARNVIDQYRLPVGQANVVAAPGYVALARLKTPPGKQARNYEGTSTSEVSVKTGSRRIISLLFG